MAFSPLDSDLLSGLVGLPAMSAVFDDRATLAAMLRVEAALARAQASVGLVPAGLAAAIEAIGPDSLDIRALGKATALSGVLPIPFVKTLQACLPAEFEKAVHFGATTQDIADSAMALQMHAAFALLSTELVATLAALAAMADRHAATACIGRTYGQHAAPVSFGFKVAVWAAGIAEVARKLPSVRAEACRAQLGGPVGTLSALGDRAEAVVDTFAAELGLSRPSVAWHARRANVAAAGQWLALLCGALAKMAGDVVALASTEVGEVAEPHVPGRGGSSAMPHKRNPVSATVILANAQAAGAHAASLVASLAAAHERPAGAWHGEWHSLATLFGLAGGACMHARTLAEGLVVDVPAMARNIGATRGLVFADAASAALAAKSGRAQAHAAVEAAATRVRASGGTLRDELAGLLDAADLDAAFDPGPAVSAAAARVAPALAEVRAALAALSS
ncbi:MAG: adenylosuccinate lyase family protein [Rhodospirillales bacterium]|nr:adenylosuccinate lyase family protein [Rhodospirillales bacterium]